MARTNAQQEGKNMTTSPEPTRDVLALIAHDEKKDTLTDFCVRHRDVLAAWDLIGTGT